MVTECLTCRGTKVHTAQPPEPPDPADLLNDNMVGLCENCEGYEESEHPCGDCQKVEMG